MLAGVNIEHHPGWADARACSSSRGDDGDEPEWTPDETPVDWDRYWRIIDSLANPRDALTGSDCDVLSLSRIQAQVRCVRRWTFCSYGIWYHQINRIPS